MNTKKFCPTQPSELYADLEVPTIGPHTFYKRVQTCAIVDFANMLTLFSCNLRCVKTKNLSFCLVVCMSHKLGNLIMLLFF